MKQNTLFRSPILSALLTITFFSWTASMPCQQISLAQFWHPTILQFPRQSRLYLQSFISGLSRLPFRDTPDTLAIFLSHGGKFHSFCLIALPQNHMTKAVKFCHSLRLGHGTLVHQVSALHCCTETRSIDQTGLELRVPPAAVSSTGIKGVQQHRLAMVYLFLFVYVFGERTHYSLRGQKESDPL